MILLHVNVYNINDLTLIFRADLIKSFVKYTTLRSSHYFFQTCKSCKSIKSKASKGKQVGKFVIYNTTCTVRYTVTDH